MLFQMSVKMPTPPHPNLSCQGWGLDIGLIIRWEGFAKNFYKWCHRNFVLARAVGACRNLKFAGRHLVSILYMLQGFKSTLG